MGRSLEPLLTPEQIESRLNLWPGLDGGTATLINLSENHTFRIDTPDGRAHILRVHRPGYHTRQGIESELAWLDALYRDAGLPTITSIPGKNGNALQYVHFPETGIATFAVLFAFEEGQNAEELDDLVPLFADLGRLSAICHRHAEVWQPPAFFQRPIWDDNAILNPDGPWGNWRETSGVTPEILTLLTRLERRLRDDLAAYGREKQRFGLIHADMRLANLLVHKGETRLIDFDDCGFGWFAYDFAAALSFFEDDPCVPELKATWLEAYRKERAFSAVDEAALDTTLLLRRMALLAWIGSHAETSLAQSCQPDFAENTAKMAEVYLTAR